MNGTDLSGTEPVFQTGLIGILGSGETAAAGGRLFESLVREAPRPLRAAVLETPAGFELNSDRVAGRVVDFLRVRLGNYSPQVNLVRARRRNTGFSPDDPGICAPLLHATLMFAGPGSPTYAVRQLAGSLAWDLLRGRLGLGAAAVFASAGAIAVGKYALPVYEIYKAGFDLHWQPGLDLFAPFGLSLVFVPHWNNSEGGAELDTSRCFMGRERFARLRELLPEPACIVGLDEHTALIFDVARARASVLGQGRVTILEGDAEQSFADGESFSLDRLGAFRPADLLASVRETVREEVLAAAEREKAGSVPAEVLALADERQSARAERDWPRADRLRNKIEALGWRVQDTEAGPKVIPGAPAR